jgi:hypothetical protein
MNKPHKWAKEIKAWADGAEIECNSEDLNDDWIVVTKPNWFADCEYRIKPQPKEPQYLYVSRGLNGSPFISFIDHQGCIGKIKLEVDDEK